MWACLEAEGHVGSIDTFKNIVLNVIFVMKMIPPTTKWAGLDEEGHVGSIDKLENIVGFEFHICDEDDATYHKACVWAGLDEEGHVGSIDML